MNVNDYVTDAQGKVWLVCSLVTTGDGEFAVLLPAKPAVRFHVDLLGERVRVPVDGLEVLKEITVTETL